MCLLIVLAGVDADWPLVVASNRDEARDRPASPPGLYVGARHRILSPRDRRAGGTWIGVNDAGLFAGLTNLGSPLPAPLATTRGDLPHVALDADDLDGAVENVEHRVAAAPHAGFQIVLSDGTGIVVLEHEGGQTVRRDVSGRVAVVGNEHRLGELELPDLPAALEPGLALEERLARLRVVLLDTGERAGHRVLKKGGAYGTVSSSLIAIPRGDLRGLVWRYSAGSPDEAPYRNYGNLSRRLTERV